jgi:hypothetical protein
MTMCREVIKTKASAKEIVSSTASETFPCRGASSKWATAGSPIQPSASDASVIPSWVADM